MMSRQTPYRTRYTAPPVEEIDSYYEAMSQFWHPVLAADDLVDGQLAGVELLEEKLVLARLNGRVVAMQDLCRHFQTKLSIGEIRTIAGAGECIMCPYHGWSYDSTGQCVDIPQLVAGRGIPKDARVPTYRTEERYGLMWVSLQDKPTFDIPEFPEVDDPYFRPGPLRVYEPWAAAAPRVIMGALDDTHFPWVHEGLLGDRAEVAAPDHQVWRDGRYLMSQYTILQPRNVTIAEGVNGGSEPALQEVTYTNFVGIPNVIRLVKDSADGRLYIIWLATMPIRYNLTQTFWRVARNYDLDPAHDQGYEDFEDQVRAQDKPIVESQRPWLLPPFWTKIELPLRPADQPLVEYQKWLEELGVTSAV
jgi:phenylpropionate dioxygenase-like ring-hydroxylating dioxygenase large terminal subunit